MGHIVVAGASRRVGFETVKLLRKCGHHVSCFFRTKNSLESVKALGAHPYIVDAFDKLSLEKLLNDLPKIDGFICSLGSKPGDEKRVDYVGASHCITLAKLFKIDRFLLVTAIGCGETWEFLPERMKQFLGAAIKAKNESELELIKSGLRYTILRPGGLSDDKSTGNAFCTKDPQVQGEIARADVAEILVRCIESKRAINSIFQVLDRTRIRTQHSFDEVKLET